MAGRIIYLEVDDEITSAAARIRGVRRGADRGRPAVRLAGRHVADQLPAAGARCADPRQAAVDRGRRSGDAGARGVGRVCRSSRRSRSTSRRWPGPTTTGRGRRRRCRSWRRRPRPAATPMSRREPAASVEPIEPAAAPPPTEPESDGTLGLIVPAAAVGAATLAGPPGDTIRAPVHVDADVPRYPRPAPPTSPADGGTRGPFAALTDRFGGERRCPDAVAHRWRDPRPGPARRRRSASYLAPAVGDDRGHARDGADRADPDDGRRRHRPRPSPTRPRASSRPRRSRSRSRSTTRSARPASGSS